MVNFVHGSDVTPPPVEATRPQRCLACDHDNPHAANFCSECGLQLNLRFCRHCDAVNARAALTCYKCGMAFGQHTRNAFDSEPEVQQATSTSDFDDRRPADGDFAAAAAGDVPALPPFTARTAEADADIGIDRDPPSAPPVSAPVPTASRRWPGRMALTLLLLPFAAVLVVGMVPPLQQPVLQWLLTAWTQVRSSAAAPTVPTPVPAASKPAEASATTGTNAAPPGMPTAPSYPADAASSRVPANDAAASTAGTALPAPDASSGTAPPEKPPPNRAEAASGATRSLSAPTGIIGPAAAKSAAAAPRTPSKSGNARTSPKGGRVTSAPSRGARASPSAPRRSPSAPLRRTSSAASCEQGFAVLGLCP